MQTSRTANSLAIKGAVKIVGCGLIGTSMALRLKELRIPVFLSDSSEKNLLLAQDLVGSSVEVKNSLDPELIIVATPPNVVLEVIKEEFSRNPNSTFIDVSGIKSKLVNQVEGISALSEYFVSVHPMAGREVSGPESARADLFESRAWIISQTHNSNQRTLEFAEELGELMGAAIYKLDPKTHDSVIAAISHLPQILSSALGGSLENETASHLNLAGQGLRDVSRLADSDPDLWVALLAGNAEEILPKLALVINRLSKLSRALELGENQAIRTFLSEGREGRNRIPGKHGLAKRDYTFVPIVIDDKPGGLARIFNECAAIDVNVEDLTMEHSPGQAVGLITLALSESDAIKLQKHLVSKGWLAHAPRKH
ncbi:MAG: prephenate dehydrogenase [Actinomycetales bacterium]|nr:MAG: prephenate dehydrogenase [Actinomycetales bacterium]